MVGKAPRQTDTRHMSTAVVSPKTPPLFVLVRSTVDWGVQTARGGHEARHLSGAARVSASPLEAAQERHGREWRYDHAFKARSIGSPAVRWAEVVNFSRVWGSARSKRACVPAAIVAG